MRVLLRSKTRIALCVAAVGLGLGAAGVGLSPTRPAAAADPRAGAIPSGAAATVPALGTVSEDRQWRQFMGPDRNGVMEDSPIAAQWPAGGPKVLWKKPCLIAHAGPALGDGVLVLLERDKAKDADEVIRALDPANGAELWRKNFSCNWPNKRGQTHGPAATPALARGKVVWLSIEGKLRCHDLRTGAVAWEKDLVKEYQMPPNGDQDWGAVTSPLVFEDRVVLQVCGGQVGLVAWTITDGKEVWRTAQFPNYGCSPGFLRMGDVPLVLGLATSRTKALKDGDLFGFDARDGTLRWSVRTGKTYYNCPMPVSGGGWVFIEGGGGDGPTVAVKLGATADDQPAVAWKVPHRLVRFSNYLYYRGLLFGQGYESHGGPKMFFCIDPARGQVLYEKKAGDVQQWMLGADGKVIQLHENGELALFDAAGGYTLGLTPAPGSGGAGVNPGAPAIPARGLRLPTTEPSGQWEYRELARAKVIDKTWSPPALSGGKLYLRSDTQVMCVDLR